MAGRCRAVALPTKDRGDLTVVLVLGEAADQLDGVVPELVALQLAGDSERHAQLGLRSALPLHVDVGAAFVVMGGDDHLADQRAQQLLAVTISRRRRGPEAREVLSESAVLALEVRQRLFQCVLESAADEPVLRLARVELPACAVGLVLRALDREPLPGEALLVLILELADRAGGRLDPGRRDRVQERVGDRPIQPRAAE
jgi:hypothetical protein